MRLQIVVIFAMQPSVLGAISSDMSSDSEAGNGIVWWPHAVILQTGIKTDKVAGTRISMQICRQTGMLVGVLKLT